MSKEESKIPEVLYANISGDQERKIKQIFYKHFQ